MTEPLVILSLPKSTIHHSRLTIDVERGNDHIRLLVGDQQRRPVVITPVV